MVRFAEETSVHTFVTGSSDDLSAAPAGGRGRSSTAMSEQYSIYTEGIGQSFADALESKRGGQGGKQRQDTDLEDGVIERPVGGATYTGQLRQGLAHGRGRQVWSNGGCYDGEWDNDEMHGTGRLETPDGARYEGQWVRNVQQGDGVYNAVDGSCYEGTWLRGKMHGKGRHRWKDGAVFVGGFVNGERSGQGAVVYANGSRLEGQWENNQPHGLGVCTSADGRSQRGEWHHGQRRRWLEKATRSTHYNFEIESSTRPPGASGFSSQSGDGFCQRCTDKCMIM